MVKSERSEQFEKRCLVFGVSVIRLVHEHPEIPQSVSNQIIRSATSIGANYAEAQNAVSRLDFKNKIGISKKEAAETRYWLGVIEQLTSKELIQPYLLECQEILLILQKIMTTLRLAAKTAT